MAFSALRNPSGRVARVFLLFFLLSLFVFYVLIPMFPNSPPASVSALFVSWFSSSSNGLKQPQMAHVDSSVANTTADVKKNGSFSIRNSTGTRDQADEQERNTRTGDLLKKDGILGTTHNESSDLLGGVNDSHGKDEILGGTHNGSVQGNGTKHEIVVPKERIDSKNGTVELTREESVGLLIGGNNGSESYDFGRYEKCDIFDGKWVRDERKPFYPPASCPYVGAGFDCYANGRSDYDFLRWRWQPSRCNIPRMNATDFLERLRGQRLVFVGDSLNRNMWESMVCTLRQSVFNKTKVFEISKSKQFKIGKHFSIMFQDHNCSVEYIKAPFLVKQLYTRPPNGTMTYKIRLDIVEDSAYRYRDADIVVFNTANWWRHKMEAKGIEFYQVRNHVYPFLPLMDAYKRGLTTWARWVDRNIKKEKTQVFFRSISLSHFSGGRWNSGGRCEDETEPIFNETNLEAYPSLMFAVEKTLKKMRTPVTYLNITKLTAYRKDGHPSIYRMGFNRSNFSLRHEDCSHWCLPGIPDAWNELLYASLLKIGRGSWRNKPND